MATSKSFAKPVSGDPGVRVWVYLGLLIGAIGVIPSLIRMLLPLLQAAIPIAVGWWVWQVYAQRQRMAHARIHTAFYQLLQTHQGRITSFDLAMSVPLSAEASDRFLSDKAKEFSAQLEVSEAGDLYYHFPTLAAPQFCQPDALTDRPSISDHEIQALRESLVTDPPELENIPEPTCSEPTCPEPTCSSEPTCPEPIRPEPASFGATDPFAIERSEEPPIPDLSDTSDSAIAQFTLTQAELAKRLSVSTSTISRRKQGGTLTEWSRTKDPEGLAWQYRTIDHQFVAVE